MPTKEPIVDTIIPHTDPKPIPTRVISTKPPAARIPKQENANHPVTTETAPVAESTTAAESVKLSPQLSALARKEQAFRQRELALKQREQDLATKLADAESYTQLKAKLGAKDFSEAEKLGLDYNEYVQYKLDQVNGEDPQAQKISALEAKLEALEKGQEESTNSQFEETVSAYRKELTAAIETKPEFQKIKRFEDEDSAGKKFTGIDIAVQLIIDTWNEDGEEMTVDQALVDTEMFIRERAKKMAALIEEPKAQEDEARNLPPPKRSPSTITNNMSPTGNAQPALKPLRELSDTERYAEARRRALARRQQP